MIDRTIVFPIGWPSTRRGVHSPSVLGHPHPLSPSSSYSSSSLSHPDDPSPTYSELQRIVGDNAQYSKLVLACGYRNKFRDNDLSQILEEESIEAAVKEAAEVSMGTDVTDLDIINIQSLAEQVLSMTEYRIQLFDYLKNRMNAIAPNLTILLGELVGARLISHSGSLMNLAKQPASTIQILGAEKALFRALKTKHDTPKYGLIYHASLVGQAAPKHKGKIRRVLAAKAALATRVDALSDDAADGAPDTTMGYEGRAKVEARLRQLEGGDGTVVRAANGNGAAAKTARYAPTAAKSAAVAPSYDDSGDMVGLGGGNGGSAKKEKKEKKSKRRADDGDAEGGGRRAAAKRRRRRRKTAMTRMTRSRRRNPRRRRSRRRKRGSRRSDYIPW